MLPHWCEIFFFADSSSILALFRTFKKSDVFARILKIGTVNQMQDFLSVIFSVCSDL